VASTEGSQERQDLVKISIGEWTFDSVDYDAESDVLYLSVGNPRSAIGEETPEGHVLLFDVETGEFCGLTLVSIRHLLAVHDDTLTVTMPHLQRIDAADLLPALA
jgi:uncharacterized protein YuzE